MTGVELVLDSLRDLEPLTDEPLTRTRPYSGSGSFFMNNITHL